MDNNILTQIGLVVLIGLAAKNTILIVEFAKQAEEQGAGRWDAAVQAARTRLRPILMALSGTQYSFATRFADGKGTNPEELIAAAHADCFSMALSSELGKAGLMSESIKTNATVTLEQTASGFAITAVHLDVAAKVPGASQQVFETVAGAAKSGCPVSKVLKAEITMAARLES